MTASVNALQSGALSFSPTSGAVAEITAILTGSATPKFRAPLQPGAASFGVEELQDDYIGGSLSSLLKDPLRYARRMDVDRLQASVLTERINALRACTSKDLGFDPPSAKAFKEIEFLAKSAADRVDDPSRLHIHPDEDGILDLVLDGEGVTITISTDGAGDIDVRWIGSKWPVRRMAASGTRAALEAMFDPRLAEA